MTAITTLRRTTIIVGSLAAASAFAASHNDAPLIAQDPGANITDVYAFITMRGDTKLLNIVMQVNPLEDPGNGVNYYRFGDDIQYNIHIAKARRRNGSYSFSGDANMTYSFYFRNNYKNFGTILSYGLGTEAGPINMTGDARQNFTQSYRVIRSVGNRDSDLSRGMTLWVPPVNVGPRTTPNYYDSNGNLITGATNSSELDSYTAETIYTLSDGSRVWCGQREDGFFADVPAIFDFIGVRNPGKDGFSGFNVHSINIQIPVSNLVSNDDVPIVGVFATTARRKVRILGDDGNFGSGDWVQVGRMGNPLFNETLVALRDKDRYNQVRPASDASRFTQYAERCEVAFLLNAVLGTNFVVNGRSDLVGLFIPDLLKVDTSTGAVPLAGQQAFNRLSVFGGDTVFSPFQNTNVAAGWPNGRRLGDDVVDIALTAIASGPSYQNITVVGDNVDSNDSVYNLTFPYAGTPFGGTQSTLHN